MYLNWTDKKLKKLKDKEYTVVLTIFGHCTTHSHGLKLKWPAWERCQFSIGTPLFHLYLYWKWREKKLWFFTFRLKVQYASDTLLTFRGRNTLPCKKKGEPRRKAQYAKVAICRDPFYYPAHNFIDVSVPSFGYAIPRFFFGYLAAAIFYKMQPRLPRVGTPKRWGNTLFDTDACTSG